MNSSLDLQPSHGERLRSTRHMPSTPFGPFQQLPVRDRNSFQHCMGFLTLPELQRASQVSTAWQWYASANHVWKNACLTNQFPLVIESTRSIQDNVKFLYSRTVSGQTLSETIGRPVMKKDGIIVAAKAGNISQRVIDMMVPPGRISANMTLLPDPFDPSKPIDLVFQCEFRFVERMLGCESLPYKLDESGNLIPLTGLENPPIEPKLTMIPLSSKNLLVLTEHPLKGQQNMPVFHGVYSQDIFDQTNTPVLKDQTRYMWRNTVLKCRSASALKVLIRTKGIEIGAPELEIVPFRSRATFDAAQILGFGTCPDDRGSVYWKYASFPDERVLVNGTQYIPAALGGFALGSGVEVDFGSGGDVGVVVGGPAEVSGP